jgi:hypothetical protein
MPCCSAPQQPTPQHPQLSWVPTRSCFMPLLLLQPLLQYHPHYPAHGQQPQPLARQLLLPGPPLTWPAALCVLPPCLADVRPGRRPTATMYCLASVWHSVAVLAAVGGHILSLPLVARAAGGHRGTHARQAPGEVVKAAVAVVVAPAAAAATPAAPTMPGAVGIAVGTGQRRAADEGPRHEGVRGRMGSTRCDNISIRWTAVQPTPASCAWGPVTPYTLALPCMAVERMSHGKEVSADGSTKLHTTFACHLSPLLPTPCAQQLQQGPLAVQRQAAVCC